MNRIKFECYDNKPQTFYTENIEYKHCGEQ